MRTNTKHRSRATFSFAFQRKNMKLRLTKAITTPGMVESGCFLSRSWVTAAPAVINARSRKSKLGNFSSPPPSARLAISPHPCHSRGVKSQFSIVDLKYGGKSLRSLEQGETFHPGTGPMKEARLLHVEQQQIQARAAAQKHFTIWDVGLGAAANALAAIKALRESPAQVEIHSFDKTLAPLEFALQHASELGYLVPHQHLLHTLVADRQVECAPHIKWFLHLGDFRETMQQGHSAPDAIFYDPYSPKGNQEMWTLNHFTELFRLLHPAQTTLLTNYTRSTAVRVTLLRAGFFVGIGSVIGEKAETTIATNQLDLLEQPLNRQWLNRVVVSRNSAPMRDKTYRLAPIVEDDLAWLRRHPQFLGDDQGSPTAKSQKNLLYSYSRPMDRL